MIAHNCGELFGNAEQYGDPSTQIFMWLRFQIKS